MASRGLKLSKAIFDALFEKYTSAVTSTDVETIVSIYAADAKIEIPVGGPVHDGFDAIHAFYRDNELAESLEVAGPACVAGLEAAVPLIARVRQEGRLLELDVSHNPLASVPSPLLSRCWKLQTFNAASEKMADCGL